MAVSAVARQELAVSTISLWEISSLLAKGRLAARVSAADLRHRFLAAG
jgi:PIN domain nuclease of toxin-antitoxin system